MNDNIIPNNIFFNTSIPKLEDKWVSSKTEKIKNIVIKKYLKDVFKGISEKELLKLASEKYPEKFI